MHTTKSKYRFPHALNSTLARAFVIAAFSILNGNLLAQLAPGSYSAPTNTPLASWSFEDNTNWTSDQGYFPISFTNLNYSWLGDGTSLVVGTNLPAWLNYNVIEPNLDTTNLVLNAPGSLAFWFAPAYWSSTNAGGAGPGQWTQLIDIGEWTPYASYGYWGLSVDSPGTNLWFLVQDGAGDTYGLSTPISWTTNYFHFIVLTYSSTNVSAYLDGELATNDPGGLSIWPSPMAVSGGMYFGSDTNGLMQAGGSFNTVETFNYPLASSDVQAIFNWDYDNTYVIDPLNSVMVDFVSAPSTPSTAPTPDVITGSGNLQWTNVPTSSIQSSNVWITNFVATMASDGSMNVMFTIQGGTSGFEYDVFANSALDFSSDTNDAWGWMGQGTNSGTYILNISSPIAYLILGTPKDSSGSGLTDAYQRLVSQTNPNVTDSDFDGIPTGWEILLGLNPNVSNFTSPSQRSNYNYTGANWLNGVTGIRTGSIALDPEGNVTSVSQ